MSIDKVCITLEASPRASLDWEKSIAQARCHVQEGKKIFWNLDLGLFDELNQPLSNQAQFMALGLGIEHFQNQIWNEFAEVTQGVSLYKGALDFIPGHDLSGIEEWAKERFENLTFSENPREDPFLLSLYKRDVALDYIKQLAALLPFGAEAFIDIQLQNNFSHCEEAIFFNTESIRPLSLKKERGNSLYSPIGVCLPPVTYYSVDSIALLDLALDKLTLEGIEFRFIAEEALITSIAGLDELYVVEGTLSSEGKRRLQGFCATGGVVHYV